jgi:serine/threonine protein phosphatase PrpC
MVEDSKISNILKQNGNLPDKALQLIELAKKAGGKDNITVVLAQSL